MSSPDGTSPRQILGIISDTIRTFPDDRATLTDQERLDLAVMAVKLAMQVQALSAALLAEADARGPDFVSEVSCSV